MSPSYKRLNARMPCIEHKGVPKDGWNQKIGIVQPLKRESRRRCFKCREFGHVASECPTRHINPLKEAIDDEESNFVGETALDESTECFEGPDEGELLMITKDFNNISKSGELQPRNAASECFMHLEAEYSIRHADTIKEAIEYEELDDGEQPVWDESEDDNGEQPDARELLAIQKALDRHELEDDLAQEVQLGDVKLIQNGNEKEPLFEVEMTAASEENVRENQPLLRDFVVKHTDEWPPEHATMIGVKAKQLEIEVGKANDVIAGCYKEHMIKYKSGTWEPYPLVNQSPSKSTMLVVKHDPDQVYKLERVPNDDLEAYFSAEQLWKHESKDRMSWEELGEGAAPMMELSQCLGASIQGPDDLAKPNRGLEVVVFHPGEQVWFILYQEQPSRNNGREHDPREEGPFRVLGRISPNIYKVDLPGAYIVSTSFRVQDLMRCEDEEYPYALWTKRLKQGENDPGENALKDDTHDRDELGRDQEQEDELDAEEKHPRGLPRLHHHNQLDMSMKDGKGHTRGASRTTRGKNKQEDIRPYGHVRTVT